MENKTKTFKELNAGDKLYHVESLGTITEHKITRIEYVEGYINVKYDGCYYFYINKKQYEESVFCNFTTSRKLAEKLAKLAVQNSISWTKRKIENLEQELNTRKRELKDLEHILLNQYSYIS